MRGKVLLLNVARGFSSASSGFALVESNASRRRKSHARKLLAAFATAGMLGAAPQAVQAETLGTNVGTVNGTSINSPATVTDDDKLTGALNADGTGGGVEATLAGGLTLTTNAKITNTGSFTLTKTVALAGFGLTIDSADQDLILSTTAVISDASNPVTGSVTLTNSNAADGSIRLDAAGTYKGSTTLTTTGDGALTVTIRDDASFGTADAGTSIGSGVTVALDGVTAQLTVAEPFTLAGGTIFNAVENNAGGNTISGTVTVTADSTIDAAANTTLTISGAVSGDDAITIGGTAGRTGVVKLTGTNAYEGTITVSLGTLQLADDDALGSSAIVVNNATLDVDNSVTIKRLSGTGAVDIASGKTLTFGDTTDTTISGVISGAGGLTKQGSSTVTLSGSNTYTGTTTINAGEITLGGSDAIKAGNSVAISGGTLNLNGKNPNLAVTMTSGKIRNGLLSGSLDSRGGTITDVTGNSAFTQTSGTTTVTGVNQFSSITMNGGTLSVAISDPNTTPITNTGTFIYSAGTISVDASSAAAIGEWTILTGDVPDAVASNTEVTFQGRTLSFSGFDAPVAGLALYDVYLKKGSLKFVSERKLAGDVCGITGLCSGGPLNGSLSGADKTAVSQVIKDVVWPSFESTDLTFGFYTGQKDFSEYVISGLMPRNIDAAGNSLSHYNDLLADTIFRRQPLRKFQEDVTVVEAAEVDAVETSSGAVEIDESVVAAASTELVENPNLASQYLTDDKWSAWVRGLGGEYKGDGEGTYVYRDYSATYGGVLLGVDYEVASDVRIGAYANNGYITMTQSAGDITGSGSWDPTGWGGGITASYTKQNFYVQGLFGASGFSGTQKRSVVDVGATVNGSTVLAQTIEGDKDVTSFVGSVRVGAPFDLGKFFLEPQLTATWTGNQESAFTEKSGDTMKLSYGGRTTNFLQTELGAKFTMPINLGKKSEIVPNIRLAWLGDWGINSAGQQIGYSFTNRTTTIESDNQTDMGMLIEGGVDYTIANTNSVSYKVYALGGVELYENNGTGWRASGGFGINF